MTKPYSTSDLSDIFDTDLSWRRRELSDLKAAIRAADAASKPALLRALITMCYAHWEGYVRLCATRYFEHLTLRRTPFSNFERQIYINSFLVRLDALFQSRATIEARCNLINSILDDQDKRFAYVNPALIDTRSNLNTDVIKDICIICGVDWAHFESKRTLIDKFLLKRRNLVAHGQQEFIQVSEADDLVADILALMQHFRGLLENKAYLKTYAA
jgi:hypothetical protein